MRASVAERRGGIGPRVVDDPRPARGEAFVRLRRAALNRFDAMILRTADASPTLDARDVYGLEDVARAYERLDSAARIGKVVLDVG